MSKNIENIVKKFEEACDNTEILNATIEDMKSVLIKYNKTLSGVEKNNKIKEIIEFGKNLEERIENVEVYNSKKVMDSIHELNSKSEERLKKFIKTQMQNNHENKKGENTNSNEFSQKVFEILKNQESMLVSIKSIENDRRVGDLESKLNIANSKISKILVEQNKKDNYYKNKIIELEKKLFDLMIYMDSNVVEEITPIEEREKCLF